MRNRQIKYCILEILNFPFQILIGMVLSPYLVVSYARKAASNMAFEDTFITEDNPWVNQEGSTMRHKKQVPWILRFLGV